MSNIRILIRDAPAMLRDILEHAISNEPDMEVIPEPLVSAAPVADQPPLPDVVVVGATDTEPATSTRALLDQWPRSQVLVISSRGHHVLMYELMPRRVDMGEMSPGELIQAIRSAVRAGRQRNVG
jgi:DNA-binding NarL/FixJ family response regulator